MSAAAMSSTVSAGKPSVQNPCTALVCAQSEIPAFKFPTFSLRLRPEIPSRPYFTLLLPADMVLQGITPYLTLQEMSRLTVVCRATKAMHTEGADIIAKKVLATPVEDLSAAYYVATTKGFAKRSVFCP